MNTTQYKEAIDRASKDLLGINDNLPAQLYHYTTAEGLEGILSSGYLRASNTRTMNDPNEMSLWWKRLREALREPPSPASKHAELLVDYLLKNLDEVVRDVLSDQPGVGQTYCISFSVCRDDLSQFRAYSSGGAGYCLCFSTEELQRVLSANSDRIPWVIAGAVYKEVDQLRIMRQILKAAYHVLASEPEERDISGLVQQLAYPILQASSWHAARFKPPVFDVEREWRIILPPGNPVAHVKAEFRDVRSFRRGDSFVDYLPLQIALPESEVNSITANSAGRHIRCLKEIILGPKFTNRQEDCDGLHHFLKTCSTLEDQADSVIVLFSRASLR